MDYVVIVAGGSGTRMGSKTPKQLMEIHGKPIIAHAIERFIAAIPDIRIILSLSDEARRFLDVYQAKAGNIPGIVKVNGGPTRYHSSLAGLKLVPENVTVGIHDAVRPLLSTNLIERCYKEAKIFGSAVPCVSLKDSLRQVSDGISVSRDRSEFQLVQTPQCFDSSLLKRAFNKGYRDEFTDEASVFEYAGNSIHITEGEPWNIKITYPEDIIVASALMMR
ncbi:MAG: 2-C-methyl-D-erythritol 4-phosphate cytidylyltransferase [Bacteroidetes bacterium]|nr:MAG: 2-C-methyl-D-erythritol 4-phosphate cytidylyltransferase [Bacteroidota bacterium]REK04831.1 MAG: 2-C-methyl-D-erythritol 4-phosphate cytidylyltransferase [Bacteroidota bacterium]REK36303.1 MAG: 2-C-methyl-D-erythritol 4-phosphate cytidylyltransferase [Bacteroidota bacterium]REK51031.1 MAG: 2-C-methyl-D-erythritol 4-phosphate cytidylyltransferase [Bacteroidota bacterium]